MSRWSESYPRLIERVLVESTRPGSTAHGEHHWQLVAHTGAELLVDVPEADLDVVFLFGLFHDSMRLNDYVDPGHGRRGGELASRLLGETSLLEPDRLETLVYACDHHTSARTSDDPTVGVCWDSDRLNLWRVAIEPAPRLLSTAPARKPERIAWAEDLQERSMSWTEICATYERLEASRST